MAGTQTQHAPADAKPRSVDAVVGRITEISTLPHVALRVMEVAQDPNTGAVELMQAVESDPSLCTRVLRCVNSAAHGLRSKVTNVQQAISYLGFSQIRNLAMTTSVSAIFKQEDAIGAYSRKGLWRHLVSVAICARLLASRLKLPAFEDAFLAGLLHDIGIILEDQHMHEAFRAVLDATEERATLAEAEQACLGFDHTILGSRIAEQWKFPTPIRDTIRFHHMSQQYRGAHQAIVQCVEVANVVCTLKGITAVGRKLVRAPLEAIDALGLSKPDVKVLAADLDQELSANEKLFEL